MDYGDFLRNKVSSGVDGGFTPVFMPPQAFDFQQDIISWAVNKGRAAILADCGLGKTLQELAWAKNVAEFTGGNVLLITVHAVVPQFIKESLKFNIPVTKSDTGKPTSQLTVTNYEQLHKFNADDFKGVVCDESSILKNFDGTIKKTVTEFMRHMPYRLLASATPAPNDFTELGTTSECLGYLGYVDMLNRYFKNNLNNSARGRMQGEVIKWRFKGHAKKPFWEWVSGWALACRKPSDLGYSNRGYDLPELIYTEHIVETKLRKPGDLFHLPAVGLAEQRTERKNSVVERCQKAADIIIGRNDFSVAWCHTNEEGDLLQSMIPGSIQISGKDSDTAKEKKFNAFVKGEARVLVTKPIIGAWGLNFQHCNHMTFFPSHSFEQFYQAIRRFWRFGQTRPVYADLIATEGERGVLNNLKRKEADAEDLYNEIVGEASRTADSIKLTQFDTKTEVPTWL